jgi:hypothetical protein
MKDLSEQDILRRIDFLLNEARCGMIKKDQTITYAMRVISNYCTIGKDAQSAQIRGLNRKMSQQAYALIKKSSSFEEWAKATTNEHQDPLEDVWQWILAEHKNLSPKTIFERFEKYPMVTITHEENKDWPKDYKDPVERYEKAGKARIDVTWCEERPKDMFRRLP